MDHSLTESELSPRDEQAAPQPPPKRRRLRVSWLLRALFVLSLAGVAAGVWLIIYFANQLPEHLDALRHWNPSTLSEVVSSDGEKIGEFYLQRRIPLEDLRLTPPHVRNAFLAAEDGRFYEHPGLDLAGISRAMVSNLMAGRVVQGGSTITQQVVKNLLLTPERTLARKIKEAILSIRVEQELTKDEILAIYLDMVYLGHGAYGVQAAAQTYFGKDVRDLTVAEAALIAGMVKAPSTNSPFRRFDKAKGRQLYVLEQMVNHGFVSMEVADAAREEPLTFLAAPSLNLTAAPEYVEQVRRIILQRYGDEQLYQRGLRITAAVNMRMQRQARLAVRAGAEAVDARNGFQGPSRVLAKGDWQRFRDEVWREVRAQRILEGRQHLLNKPPVPGEVHPAVVIAHGTSGIIVAVGPYDATLLPADLKRGVKRQGENDKWLDLTVAEVLPPGAVLDVRWLEPGADGRPLATLEGVTSAQAALISVEPGTGLVRAMVGATDPMLSRFNRATQGKRQPGSTFKTFIYLAAIAAGHRQTDLMRDAPVTFRMPGGRFWSPHNYSDRYYGPVTLRTALAKSANSVALRLLDEVGVDQVLALARRMGVESALTSNLTLGLGTSEMTLAELTRAYAIVASGGRAIELNFVQKVETADGRVLERLRPPTSPAPATNGELPPGYAVDPATAFVVASMLQEVVEGGTARGARGLGRPTAGKTGTTNDYKDAWFVGFTPELVTGVWVGNDGNHGMGPKETGGLAAVPIWKGYMTAALEGVPEGSFALPPGVVYLRVDPHTGAAAPTGRQGEWLPFRLANLPAGYNLGDDSAGLVDED